MKFPWIIPYLSPLLDDPHAENVRGKKEEVEDTMKNSKRDWKEQEDESLLQKDPESTPNHKLSA